MATKSAEKDEANSLKAEVAPEQDLWFEITEGKPWDSGGEKRVWVHWELMATCFKCKIPLYANRSIGHKAFDKLPAHGGKLALFDPDQDKWYCPDCAPKTKTLYEHAGKCAVCGQDTFMNRLDGKMKNVPDEEHRRLLGNKMVIQKRTSRGEPPMPVCGNCEEYPTFEPGEAKAQIFLNALAKITGMPVRPGSDADYKTLLGVLNK